MGLGAVALGAMALGSGVSAVGAVESGQAQAASANYMAQVATNNAAIERQNAQLAIEQGQVAQQNQQLQTGQKMGGILAQQAASGVAPNTGSALDVRASTAEMGALDELTIRYNSQMASRNALIGAESYQAQAGLYSAQAGWDTTAGYFGMGSSLLGGASSVSNRWLQYNLQGVFGSSSNPAGPEGLMG
ncbi:MAG TPA: hypothetical protein VEF34_03775 [Syntrophobacteraceae bacterium]|nr:hypothetical protein [Syntrophobacteraceae bacterium]